MTTKTCPECARQLSVDSLRCGCGFRFREMGFGWTEGLGEFSLPKTGPAWVLIVAACPTALMLFALLAWLDWFDLGTIAASLMGIGAIVLPLAAQYLPTFRLKGGGCCLGCLTWISLGVGVWVAASLWSFGDPVIEREVIPVARMEAGPCQIDGVSLGDTVEAVRGLPETRWERLSFPYLPGEESYSLRSDKGTLVTLSGGRVIRVEGQVFSQDGKELVRAGAPRKNIGYVFDPSQYHTPRRRYVVDKITYDFRIRGTELIGIMMAPENTRLVAAPSRVTVNGIALGLLREELELGPPVVAEPGWRYGDALVYCDKGGRISCVRGTTLEKDGELLARVGDTGVYTQRIYLRPTTFEGVQLAIQASGNPRKIDGITIK